MSSKEEDHAKRLRSSFGRALDDHGYGLQYAVGSTVQKLEAESGWRLSAFEFPVQVRGDDTHVDLILQHGSRPWFLVMECKRTNPDYADWCFVRAPSVGQWLPDGCAILERIFVEYVHLKAEGRPRDFSCEGVRWKGAQSSAFLGLEMRRGNGQKPLIRGAMDQAVAQVLRGMNGFVQYLSTTPELLNRDQFWFLAPVIVTTASLWLSDVDLSLADLRTGKVDIDDSTLRRVPWVSYHYHQGLGLKHDAGTWTRSDNLASVLEGAFRRTVFVVSVEGLEGFLSTMQG